MFVCLLLSLLFVSFRLLFLLFSLSWLSYYCFFFTAKLSNMIMITYNIMFFSHCNLPLTDCRLRKASVAEMFINIVLSSCYTSEGMQKLNRKVYNDD